MKARQLEKLGIPAPLTRLAKWRASEARAAGASIGDVRQTLRDLVAEPESFRDHPHFADLAGELSMYQRHAAATAQPPPPRREPAPYRQWGEDLDDTSVQQMHAACMLPVAVAGALMPDAHVGYGLPIGGVLATRNAVIPYAVGVDIACRVKLSVLDLPAHALTAEPDRLINALESETRFGIGARFGGRGDRIRRRDHPVLDDDWSVSPITRQLRDKAAQQLGTSGSGNHFVEFGTLEVDEAGARSMQLPFGGTYLALLSHSGSRGTGAAVCQHYSNVAMKLHPHLPRHQQHLAWLDLDSHEGREYWHAMSLMGRYAAANHAVIHDAVSRALGARVIAGVENHHNFAWEEEHLIDGQPQRLIVHRKGATPADRGVLGIIPGSMAAPGYVVRGKGQPDSLLSASHGAGRVMSRRAAIAKYRWADVRPMLEKRGVTLLSAGLDENPLVYKDIETVMNQQHDLVERVARFDPRLVKMAPPGERAED
jgi:tRNA-splicing ligase RtcB